MERGVREKDIERQRKTAKKKSGIYETVQTQIFCSEGMNGNCIWQDKNLIISLSLPAVTSTSFAISSFPVYKIDTVDVEAKT